MIDSSWRTYFYNYLRLFWNHPAFSFFKNNNYCFQGNVGHHCQKSYWKRSWPIHQIPFKVHYFMRIFGAAKASLVYILNWFKANEKMQSSHRGFYPNAPIFQDGGYKTRRIIKYFSKEITKWISLCIICYYINFL